MKSEKIPRVVIVGAGFGRLKAAQALRRAPIDLTMIDRNNYHLFQPLLYQVAAAYLDPEQIAKPVRGIFRGQKNLGFKMTEMVGVDFPNRALETTSGAIPYDYLILAVGGQTNFFGMSGVEEQGFSLKRLADGVGIRNHLLTSFEKAALEPDSAVRRGLLTAVVGGGGAAGVEMAGALATIGRNAAVARVKGLKFSGFPAWLVWLVVHLIRLVGFRNRLVVLINWAWDYFFFERASRIIIDR